MTPAEHREKAQWWLDSLDQLIDSGRQLTHGDVAGLIARAQVHATLALAPAAPPAQSPQHRWSLDKPHEFPDATGLTVRVQPTADRTGVVLAIEDIAVLLENPDILRTLASLLTAHADRLEPKP